MKNLFDVLKILTERKVYFCFQSRPNETYYNLAIADKIGNRHYFSSNTLASLTDEILLMYPDIETKRKAPPVPTGMPKPPGF